MKSHVYRVTARPGSSVLSPRTNLLRARMMQTRQPPSPVGVKVTTQFVQGWQRFAQQDKLGVVRRIVQEGAFPRLSRRILCLHHDEYSCYLVLTI